MTDVDEAAVTVEHDDGNVDSVAVAGSEATVTSYTARELLFARLFTTFVLLWTHSALFVIAVSGESLPIIAACLVADFILVRYVEWF